MMVHPPMLYSGYTLCTIPFAFAVGALITRRVEADWIGAVRRFALAAWFFLGIGILLGARWSWSELGWGGYWAWDPVENAALMPWLTGTAFLHSIMVQQRRGMLKTWNVSLVLATGFLAILGTFLVRSGVLESIHAFGASTLGIPFLTFVALLAFGSIWLVLSRREGLRSEHRIDSLLSREAVFVLNNLVLVALCFVIFWGTFFPLISEAVTGTRASVGPPWFDRYTVPLAIVLVLLSGIGPLVAWRRVTPAGARRSLPRSGGVRAGRGGGAAGRARRRRAPGRAAHVRLRRVRPRRGRPGGRPRRARPARRVARARAGRARRRRAPQPAPLRRLPRPRRHGGALRRHRRLDRRSSTCATPGSCRGRARGWTATTSATCGRRASSRAEKISLGAVLEVRRGGRLVATLRPSRGYYPSSDPGEGPIGRFFDGESTSEVGLRAGARRDVWTSIQPDIGPLRRLIDDANQRFATSSANVQALVVAGLVAHYEGNPPPATFRFIVSPLVEWIWFGGLIVLFGGLIAIWPAAAFAQARAAAAGRCGRGPGRRRRRATAPPV